MGLFNFLKRFSRSEREIRILVLGLDNAGKTTILKLLNDEDISDVVPTTGANVRSIITSFGVRVNAWDIGGQKRLRQLWKSQFDNTDVLIYVVDSSDKARLEESAMEFRIILQEQELKQVPLLVYANKQDIEGRLDAQDIADALGVFELNDRLWRVQPCSTSNCEGISEGLEWACKATGK